jgi:hypothetical protein
MSEPMGVAGNKSTTKEAGGREPRRRARTLIIGTDTVGAVDAAAVSD